MLCTFLKGGCATAQPIQLIPQKSQTPQVTEEIMTSPLLPPLAEAEEEDGGFWEGTPPSIIETYFSKIPIHLTSPTLRALRTEVLKEKYPALAQNSSYEKERLSLFKETGQLDAARELLLETSLPNKEALLLDLQWQGGEAKKACEKISNLIRSSSNREWKEQNIYCLYATGEEERGKIALELLSESNSENISLLKALFDPSSPPPFDPSFSKSPFLLTVWSETGQEIPEDDLNNLSPASLVLLTKLEKIPQKTRLLAAQKAFTAGSLEEDDFSRFIESAPADSLLGKFAAALKTQTTEDLLPLFEEAAQDHLLSFIAKVFKADLLKIEPSLETLPLAPYLIHAFLEDAAKDRIKKWGAFYMREAPDEAIAVLPLLRLSLPNIKWTEDHLQAWQAYQKRLNPSEATQHSYALRRLFEALGESSGSPMTGEPSPLSWRQEKSLFEGESLDLLDAAVKSHRQGEIFLLTLNLIGETPLKDVSPDKMARLLEALKKAGYDEKARSLALDFLLAKGI
ncbi:MAG: hypothetical protein HYX35_01650 [Proteobacteria bacterium]|nr:hypothetical protein [Pseudomonadota bacterium]